MHSLTRSFFILAEKKSEEKDVFVYTFKSFFHSFENRSMHKARNVLLAGFLAFTRTRQKVMDAWKTKQ